ncbi:MAG: hypothetical protein K9H14_06185 [Actinomycetia bacterium]|nr:hypothetical protein [Actinomycetes bacterium]
MGAINSSRDRCRKQSCKEIYLDAVQGFDYQFNIYRMQEGVIKGNINILMVDVCINNLNEDSEIELLWMLGGKEIYRSNDLSAKRKNIYSGGIVLKQGYLPQGSYCVTLLNKGRPVDMFSFNIESYCGDNLDLK